MRKIVVAEEYAGYEINRYLRDVEGFSGRGLRKMTLFLNKKAVKSGEKKLKAGDIIGVVEEKKGTNLEPIEMEIDVVYEDRNVLIVNKPPFLVTHPTAKKVDKTLANGILHYFQSRGIGVIPRFYNRLDMNTSGMIVIAKNGYSQAFLQNFGEVNKKYIAIVKGIVKEEQFYIDKKIAVSADGIKREIRDDGQEAKTKIVVIKRDVEKDVTIVEAELFSGRTHQIRVHLSSIGYPILGDELYGGSDKRAKRQMLHSYKLSLIDPESKDRVNFEIDTPEDMKEI